MTSKEGRTMRRLSGVGMTEEDKAVATIIVFIILATLVMLVGVKYMDMVQMHDCLAMDMKWSNGQCWEEQP